MVEVTVRVCDRCKRMGYPTLRYTLAEGGRKVTRDLCEDHAGPIEALMKDDEQPEPAEAEPARKVAAKKPVAKTTAKKTAAKKATTAKKAAGRPRGATKTMTVEEIAKLRNPQ